MRKGLPVLLLTALVALAVVVTALLTGDASGDQLHITEVYGTVSVTDSELNSVEAVEGIALSAEDRIVTGPDGRAVLQLGPETRIRLQEQSTIQVRSVTADEVQLELEDGLLSATVRPTSSSVRVSSGGREVLGVDADFAVGVDDQAMAIEAERGILMLQGIPGQSQLGPEERLLLPADGQGQITGIPDELLLDIEWPEPEKTTADKVATISGSTAPGATVIVISGTNHVPVVARADGSFSAEIPLNDAVNVVRVEALGLLGASAKDKGEIHADHSVDLGPIEVTHTGGGL